MKRDEETLTPAEEKQAQANMLLQDIVRLIDEGKSERDIVSFIQNRLKTRVAGIAGDIAQKFFQAAKQYHKDYTEQRRRLAKSGEKAKERDAKLGITANANARLSDLEIERAIAFGAMVQKQNDIKAMAARRKRGRYKTKRSPLHDFIAKQRALGRKRKEVLELLRRKFKLTKAKATTSYAAYIKREQRERKTPR